MKKRRNSKGKKPAEKDSTEISMFGNTFKNCEEGLSPKIQFTRKRYNKNEEYSDD